MNLKALLQGFGFFAILLTLAPFIAADYWWIRIFDFPHTQLTILSFVALITYFFRFDIKRVEDYIFVVILGCCFTFQIIKILPYTPLVNYEMLEAEGAESPQIKFYIANVLQDNKNPQKLLQEIKAVDADVILLMETNSRWMQAVRPAVEGYEYRLEFPLDNTYGMLMYSKYPLKNGDIKFLVDDSIPSIDAILQLPSKDEVQFYGIHPTPPMPQHNPSSTDRDAEMMLVAKKARSNHLPVLVVGDFNDVAWSQSTTMFKEGSSLLDPRIGRGFYNTFNANSPIMRWPLDHFFASEEFRLKSIALGKDIDSDHFPAIFEVTLEPGKADEQKQQAPSSGQIKQANEQIKKAREDNAEGSPSRRPG